MKSPQPYTKHDHGLPEFNDRKAMWENLSVQISDLSLPKTSIYLDILRSLYVNGSVVFRSFSLGESEVLDWYISRNQFNECFFFWKFWMNSTVQSNLPISHIVEDSYRDFSPSTSYHLSGDLASILNWGGAYEDCKLSGQKIMGIAQAASNELVGNNYKDILVFINTSPWCDFFFDVAWDKTVTIIDLNKRLIHVIMATDTD